MFLTPKGFTLDSLRLSFYEGNRLFLYHSEAVKASLSFTTLTEYDYLRLLYDDR